MELTAKMHLEDGSYWAEIAELPGCFASGKTLDELFDALSEGVELYLSKDDARGDPPKRSLHIATAVLTDAVPA